MTNLDKCKQIIDTESGRVLLYRDEVEAVLTAGDTISRRQAKNELCKMLHDCFGADDEELDAVRVTLDNLPTAQRKRTEERTETHACDCIDRQAAIDALGGEPEVWSGKDEYAQGLNNQWHYDRNAIKALPSAQPERTCVNCGRTVNNGGWYADGGTRCPIEEHYALPKDGYCHLWEKRSVTDDDYPERRTDEPEK